MNKQQKYFAATIVFFLFVVACVVYQKQREANDYECLFKGKSPLVKLQFTGHQTNFETSDESVLRDFEHAFRKVSDTPPQTGIMYTVRFFFGNGRSLQTSIMVDTNRKSFQITDFSHVSVGDPRYVSFDFSDEMTGGTSNVLRRLIWF